MDLKDLEYAKTANFQVWATEKDGERFEGVLYFEHNDYGDEYAGHIWQVDGYIEDYDGVYSLPKELEDLFLGYM